MTDLMDALGLQRVSILAMSGGVPPALKFAELYPDRTKQMALLSSAPFTPFRGEIEDRPLPTWVYSRLLSSDALYWLLTKTARGQLMAAFDARPELREKLTAQETRFVDDLIDGFLPGSRRLAGIANEGAAVAPAAEYDLAAITAPVLVFHARDDGMNPFVIAGALDEGIANARLIAFDTGGHLLLGHHAAIARELDGFFGGSARTAPRYLAGLQPGKPFAQGALMSSELYRIHPAMARFAASASAALNPIGVRSPGSLTRSYFAIVPSCGR